MRVVPIPVRTSSEPVRKRKRRFVPVITILVVVASLTFNYVRPLPAASVRLAFPEIPAAQQVALDWPKFGQSSLAAEGYGVLATSGEQVPLSTASIAKVITALCVLEKAPLKSGEQGPTLTMTEADAARYRDQVEANGSRLYVEPGVKLTQYKALQALMLPSANNIADTLAIWAFGSLPEYQTYANQYLLRNGLTQTWIGSSDASGLDPATRSTASDLAKLGLIAIREPVLVEIASQKAALFPLVGEMTNYNTKLGGGVLTGIKTGNNDENLGALLYAAPLKVGNKTITITGAVMGASGLELALDGAESLARSAPDAFEEVVYLRAGDEIGTATTEWGATASVRVRSEIRLVRWKGATMELKKTIHGTTALREGSIGAIVLKAADIQSSSSITIDKPASGPDIWWRLTRL